MPGGRRAAAVVDFKKTTGHRRPEGEPEHQFARVRVYLLRQIRLDVSDRFLEALCLNSQNLGLLRALQSRVARYGWAEATAP
jgi:hypothetical protein